MLELRANGGEKRPRVGQNSPESRAQCGPGLSALSTAQASITLAGLLFSGLLGFRFHRLGAVIGAFVLVATSLAALSCGSRDPPKVPKGTYTVTIVGTDTSSSSISASTTITLTID